MKQRKTTLSLRTTMPQSLCNTRKPFETIFMTKILAGLGMLILCVTSCQPNTPPETKHIPPPQYIPVEKHELVIYKSPNIKGYKNRPVIIDLAFVPAMNKINSYAEKNNVRIYVTSSFRNANQKLNGTIVTPARKSNHLVGHAIDMNIVCNGKWYDSNLIKKSNLKRLPVNVRNFINEVRKTPGLRWGGDFRTEDPVHIDDHLNADLAKWQKIFRVLQKRTQ